MQSIRTRFNRRLTGAIGTRKARGFSLIEFILVAGLVAVGLVAAFNSYQSSKLTSEANTEATNVSTIVAKVKSIFAGRNSYTGLSTSMLINAKGFPASMVNGANVTNTWGGAVTVGVNATQGFDITYAGVPTAACLEVVGAIGGQFLTVKVDATTVKAANATQVDVAALNTACSAGTTTTVILNGV